MQSTTEREKQILECLCTGLADKSHRQKTGHQLPDRQLASAQSVRPVCRQKQRPSHLPRTPFGKRPSAILSFPDSPRKQHPAPDHAGFAYGRYRKDKRYPADYRQTAPRAYPGQDANRQHPRSRSPHPCHGYTA